MTRVAAASVILAALGLVSGARSSPAGALPRPTTSTARPAPLGLIIEPAAGMGPIYALLGSPRKTLDMVMYELVDSRVEQILAADAERGVRVRVILDKRYEESENAAAFAFLASHHVSVRWASSRFELTHEKSFVLDASTAAVMTLNFTSRYYSSTRDVAVIDSDERDVAAIEATFRGDWAGEDSTAPSGDDLIWSPSAESALVALIGSATSSLLVENEEMGDDRITAALAAAEHRGVRVEVVMTESSSWSAAFKSLEESGVLVRVYTPSAPLYIHAKLLVVDAGRPRQRAFVGSQNFSVSSLSYNRELGIITAQPTVVAQLAALVRADASGAAPWR